MNFSYLNKLIYKSGSKKGKFRPYFNAMLVFLISGLLHGADWTFVLWGILRGLLSMFEQRIGIGQKLIGQLKKGEK